MITKRIRVSARCGLLLAGVLALGTCAAMAQNDGPPPGQGGPGGGQRGRGFDPQRQVEMLTQRLNLTADQQTQVKAVLTEQRQKMEALRNAAPADSADSSQATPNRRQQMEAIRTDTDTKITALLNDDQKAKYAAMVQKRNQRMEEHGGAPPPPPPGV